MFYFPNSDHLMFYREFAFCLLINYAYTCTCIRLQLKETVLWGTITLPEMGKQNISAKKVYWFSSFQFFFLLCSVFCFSNFRGAFFVVVAWTPHISAGRPFPNRAMMTFKISKVVCNVFDKHTTYISFVYSFPFNLSYFTHSRVPWYDVYECGIIKLNTVEPPLSDHPKCDD